MKTLTTWMLGLALPLLAFAPACNDEDDGDSAGDDGNDDDDDDDDDGDDGDDDGSNDDGSNDDGSNDDGSNDDGSNDDGSNDDGTSPGGDVGDECTSDADCAENACLFAGDVDYGFCSKVCDDVFDCPDFWECSPVGNASANYCVPPE